MKRLFCFVCLLPLFFLFFACHKEEELDIVFPESFYSSAADEWAVVNEPYTAYFNESALENLDVEILGHARIGDVIRVCGKKISKNHVIWYQFEKGWISSEKVTVYSNKLKAEKASVLIK